LAAETTYDETTKLQPTILQSKLQGPATSPVQLWAQYCGPYSVAGDKCSASGTLCCTCCI